MRYLVIAMNSWGLLMLNQTSVIQQALIVF